MLNKHRELFLALVPLVILVGLFGFLFFRSNLILSQSAVVSNENVLAEQIAANYYQYSDANLKKSNR